MEMKDRIREIMESEDYTPARFADTLDIGRAIISHILNGRNNPSLDVISRILEAFPSINPDWLLFGTGNMLREDLRAQADNHSSQLISPEKNSFDLFSQPQISSPEVAPKVSTTPSPSELKKEPSIEISQATPKELPETDEIIRERIVYKSLPDKKISQIIIYYDDNTFEVFNR